MRMTGNLSGPSLVHYSAIAVAWNFDVISLSIQVHAVKYIKLSICQKYEIIRDTQLTVQPSLYLRTNGLLYCSHYSY